MEIDASVAGERASPPRVRADRRVRDDRRAARRPAADPAVRWLWVAACLACVGLWMQDCAAPWLMTELTSDARLVAATQAATALAVCVAVVLAGALADTVDGRRLLYCTQMAACVVALAVGVLVLAGVSPLSD